MMDVPVGSSRTRASRADTAGAVVKRHSLATRLTHWSGALAMLVLVMSGLAIFDAAPYLDASDLSSPAHRILSIEATTPALGQPHGVTHVFGWTIDTTHVLGFTDNGQGGEAPRAFPGWITFPGYQDLADGRRWHLFSSWVLVIAGAVYFFFGALRREVPLLVVRPSDFRKMWPMQAYYFGLRKEPPPHGKYNPLQKLGYTALLFGVVPFVIVTGLALSPGVDAIAGPLTTLLGGRQFARTWHFIAMLVIIAFTLGHVFLVVSTGVVNNMRSIVLGTYRLGKNEGTGP
ncbi:MAG: cytochrome b/b6 domain-containing protein [Vulcanimicrobiaceae bacterium]